MVTSGLELMVVAPITASYASPHSYDYHFDGYLLVGPLEDLKYDCR